jgi:hypothetical protein
MIYHLVVIPKKEDLEILNNLRNYISQNNFRFKNKPISSDTHMTIAEVDIEDYSINTLKDILTSSITALPFSITEDEWILTKEEKEPNYKQDNPYTWIAIKIPKREELYKQVEKVIDQMGINRNSEYISNVKRIEKKENEFIANHINLSNYTRREKADECWNYFNKRLPKKIVFDTLALRDLDGNHLFEIKY